MPNPYTLTFGKEPLEHINRVSEKQTVLDDFLSPSPSQQVFVITGVRGSGKTVFMTDISKTIQEEKEWIIVDLNPNSPDLLKQAGSYLCSNDEWAGIFRDAKLNFSLFGFDLEVNNSVPIADMQTALEKMITSLVKKNKKILFTIDEVNSSSQMREFTFAFQQFLRKDLPVYLLMTGLYQNISGLQNQEGITFLYRAPKIYLSPLNIGAMASNYQANLRLDRQQAENMARITKGYSFAFQVLGYLAYNAKGDYRMLVPQLRQYLEEMSYEKIWSELTPKEQTIIKCLAETDGGSNQEVMKKAGLKQNEFNPYRRRLIRKGIVDGSKRGYLYFSLPFFKEFVLENA